jgi:hypothetical protein
MKDGRQNRGIEQQRAACQRANHNMKQHDVQDSFPLPRLLPRQEIERAHGDAQRKHRHGRRHHQKCLLKQSILLSIQAADQQQR